MVLKMKNNPLCRFMLTAAILTTLLLAIATQAQAQNIPSGPLVRIVNCSLHDNIRMNEVVRWGRAQQRDDSSPGAVFFRQAVFGGRYRESNDFTIASYYPSYSEMLARVAKSMARPDARLRTGTRGSDLFSCDPASARLTHAHPVNPGNNDGFAGDNTLMTTRFCRLNDGSTMADAYEFARGVARNYANAGDRTLYQMYTLEQGPVGSTDGQGVVFAHVPATSASFGERMDLVRDGFDPLEGLRPLPVACDYPSMWRTYAIHRGGNN